jgi:ABC transporter
MAAVIEVEELRKRYGGLTAVDGVSFRVAEREVFGIVGPNGAGKTTTVEIVEGLRRPDGGRVRVLGLDPGRDGPGLRQQIGGPAPEGRPARPAQGLGGPGPVRLLLRPAGGLAGAAGDWLSAAARPSAPCRAASASGC